MSIKNRSSPIRVIQFFLKYESGTMKYIFLITCIISDCEIEVKLWRVVDAALVERPFVVHRDFGIVTEEVGDDL